MKKILFIAIAIFFICNNTFSQKTESYKNAQKYLNSKGEVIIRFKAASESQFEELNRIISVDHKKVDKNNLDVEAYVTKEQFKKFLTFGLAYEVKASDNETPIEPSSINRKTAGTWDTTWDAYPKYSEYVAKMQYWATTYPSLCSLQNIGSTPNGRALYVLKISDNAITDETEPEFLYTSSMHGDEITGYPNMLHLIDYLLTNYGSNSEVTNIVNGTEIYICPLANPDGSYKTAGNDVYNSSGNAATRANANGYDLNRNYPDPLNGLHPDSGLQTNPVYQPETSAFMAFERTRNFVISANYHGGAEVLNFPWDTYPTPTANIHPHDNYFKYLTTEYATLAQTADGNLNYMDDVYGTGQFPGTTNGSAWYTISGGRQDYNNYFNHNKEVTIEISVLKTPLASDLTFFWDRNRQAFLNYIKQASYGVQGTVTDASGNPIHAKVYVSGTQDGFGAWVETSPTVGDYHKVQIAGTYSLIFEAPGYTSQTISSTIVNGAATILNVVMIPTTPIPVAADPTICFGKTAALSATGSGTINWYTSATATTPVATGSSFPTPALNTTTSYYVEDVVTPANVGPTTFTGSLTTTSPSKYLIFDCTTPTKLKSVSITNSAVGQLLVELQNSAGVTLESKVILLATLGTQDINLDFFLPVQTNLRLVLKELYYTNLAYSKTGITYPYTNGTVSITGNSGAQTFFPFFNWKFAPIKSNRDEVTVTVKPNPTNASIAPTSINAGSSNFTLTLNGTNFVSGESVIRWNGSNRTTTFVSSTQLTSTITSAEITTAGTVNVSVYNTCNLTNSSNQTFTIQSSGCAAPVANVASLPAATGQCSATVTAPTATSACYGTITGTTLSPLTYNTQGTFNITWTYDDGNGNTSTQTQTVIVNDTTAPVANVASLATVIGQCSATVTAPTATDACSGTITGTTASPLTYSAQGTYSITWTYTDTKGNTSTQTQTVIVNDTILPICITKDITITVSGSGSTVITTNDIDNGSSDNCGINTMSLDKYDFTTSDIGIQTVTLTVTDNNGNSANTTAQVTVQGSLGVRDLNSSLLTIYPIPFSDQITIKVPDSYIGNTIYVQLYDLNGRIICNNRQKIIENNFQIKDLDRLSDGGYIIYLTDENQKKIERKNIIKKDTN